MKTIKRLSPEANSLRKKFQNQIVLPYIKRKGSIAGYQGQIYLLLPRFDKRLKLYRNVARDTYEELQHYLSVVQSQRRFAKQENHTNGIIEINRFKKNNLSICYERVWHSGTTCDTGEHWAAQAAALRSGIEKFNFTYYENDYNFSKRLHEQVDNANPLLVSIYSKIIDEKLGSN